MLGVGRSVLVAVGLLSLGLGVVGIFLPLVPTTPFLLVAVACFARGSERLHRWLLGHPALGPYVRDWLDGRGLPARVKATALAALWIALPTSAALLYARLGPSPAWLVAAVVCAASGLGVTAWILRLPTRGE